MNIKRIVRGPVFWIVVVVLLALIVAQVMTAGAGFEIGRRHCVVAHRHAHKVIEPIRPPAGRGETDLLVADRSVLLVNPKAVIAADHADEVEHDRMDDAAGAKDATELAFGEQLFEGFHRGELGEEGKKRGRDQETRVLFPLLGTPGRGLG